MGVGNKGVINVIELVVVIITLIVSFSIFFPGTKYENRWSDAYGVMLSRDAVLSLERTGKLQESMFDTSEMNQILDKMFPNTQLILWHEITGGIGGEIRVACNCSQETIATLDEWFDGLKLNNRNIDVVFCYTDISQGDSCMANSDMLLILGDYVSLNKQKDILDEYIANGNGVVEVTDFTDEDDIQKDSVQKDIFGLRWISIENGQFDYAVFSRTPASLDDKSFMLYKYFYHVPIPLKATLDGGMVDGCEVQTRKGYLNIRGGEYGFWICSSDFVFFDTDGNGIPNQQKAELDSVSIGGYNFYLNYIESNQISMSFRPVYRFENFLSFLSEGAEWKTVHIEPRDDDTSRILIKSVNPGTQLEYPAVIINNIGTSNVAWMAHPEDNGYDDDEKTLILSLILWASNKDAPRVTLSGVKAGYKTSYLKVSNRDMFEIHKFDFGVGYPF